jgi:hypothetical protein
MLWLLSAAIAALSLAFAKPKPRVHYAKSRERQQNSVL